MNRILTLVLAATLSSGCGTISTTFTDDDTARKRLNDRRTHCASVPRVYSGVAYDFCVLNAEPGHLGPPAPGIPFIFYDQVFSGVADTVALPYTLFLQMRDGNLDLN